MHFYKSGSGSLFIVFEKDGIKLQSDLLKNLNQN